jgi:hypothetical protein
LAQQLLAPAFGRLIAIDSSGGTLPFEPLDDRSCFASHRANCSPFAFCPEEVPADSQAGGRVALFPKMKVGSLPVMFEPSVCSPAVIT